jgi:hypothetical protein
MVVIVGTKFVLPILVVLGREVGGKGAALMLPRAYLAQRAAWLRLRDQLRRDSAGAVVGAAADPKALAALFKAFDALPYQKPETRRPGDRDSQLPGQVPMPWLPTGEAVRTALAPCAGGLSVSALNSLANAAAHEIAKLRHLVDEADRSGRSDQVSVAAYDGLLWVGLGTERAFLKSAQHAAWLSNAAKREWRHSQTRFPVTRDRFEWLRRQHALTAAARGSPTGADSILRIGDTPPSIETGARIRGRQPVVDDAAFLQDAFNLLARYDGLGGGTGGAGNQAAVPDAVYTAVEAWACAPAGSCAEGFASPLNHRLVFPASAAGALGEAGESGASEEAVRTGSEPAEKLGGVRAVSRADILKRSASAPAWYCSAFADVDEPFGSAGSFLDLKDLEEYWSVVRGHDSDAARHALLLLNPPFFASHMEALAVKLERLFAPLATSAAAATGMRGSSDGGRGARGGRRDATAVVVVRSGPGSHSMKLRASEWYRGFRELPAGAHGFLHGSSHARAHYAGSLRPCNHASDLHVLSTLASPEAGGGEVGALLPDSAQALRTASSSARRTRSSGGSRTGPALAGQTSDHTQLGRAPTTAGSFEDLLDAVVAAFAPREPIAPSALGTPRQYMPNYNKNP